MRLLLDTHVFLWWVEGERVLPARVRAALGNPDNECFFSVASAWELAIKSALGKLRLAVPVARYVLDNVNANSFTVLDVRLAHIGLLESLPSHHRDPFDRLLIAQAVHEQLVIATADPVFAKYGVKRIW
jgi:PIN domain nuclease of toxin-antitoxin system